MTCQINIGYINVRGLTDDKFFLFTRYIKESPILTVSPSFDVLFISESWFINHEAHLSHPYVLSSSVLRSPRTMGHQNGGIIVLISQSMKKQIVSVTSTEFFITINLAVPCLSITGVYFPPSLCDSNVELELRKLNNSDIILGDINVRYGSAWNDLVSGPPGRKYVFDSFVTLKNLVHLRSDRGNTRVDHVFVNPHVVPTCQLSFITPSVSTDHPLVSLSIDGDTTRIMAGKCADGHIRRYYIKYLDTEITAKQFGQLYDDHEAPALSSFLNFMEKQPRDSIDIDTINAIDELLLHAIQSTSEDILGSYMVSETKRRDDFMSEALSDKLSIPGSHGMAVRLHKRSNRSRQPMANIASRDPSVSLLEDAALFYEDTFRHDCTLNCSHDIVSLLGHDPKGCQLSDGYPINDGIINVVIGKYPRGKSPGVDGVDIMQLKCLSKNSKFFVYHLKVLFSLCYDTGIVPDRWKESIIFPIPKSSSNQGEHEQTIQSFRPISIIVLFRRLFEQTVYIHLQLSPELSRMRTLDPGQAGFRTGFSTLTHALVSHESSRLFSIKVFIDLKQAYDRVLVALVLRKLHGRSCPPSLLYLFNSLFSECSSRVVIYGQQSRTFRRQRGLLQGSPLSPFLFNIFIDDLVSTLNSLVPPGCPPNALLFADDIQLQAYTIQEAQQLLDIVSAWLSENIMEANLSKCGVMLCTVLTLQQQILPGEIRLYLSGKILPIVESYEYLGFPHKHFGIDWGLHAETVSKKCLNRLNSIRASDNMQVWPEWAKIAIYKTFVRSLLDYGGPIISHIYENTRSHKKLKINSDVIRIGTSRDMKKFWYEIESIQNLALSWVFGCRRQKIVVLQSISAMGSLRHRFKELACRFSFHIGNSSLENPIRAFLGLSGGTNPVGLPYKCLNDGLRISYDLIRKSQNTNLRTYLILERIKAIERSSTLARYISPWSRYPQNCVDKCLHIKDRLLRRLIILWRCNSLGVRRVCGRCGGYFNRSHIPSCFQLPSMKVSWLPESSSNSLKNYNYLDELVNNGHYELFQTIWNQILCELV